MTDDRSGFTLIEVMIALVILSVVLLGLAGTVGALSVQVARTTSSTEAIQLAESRITRIELNPQYDSLETWFQGEETDVNGTGYDRETVVVQWGGPGESMNHKVVTVSVSGEGLVSPVSRTTAVAAP